MIVALLSVSIVHAEYGNYGYDNSSGTRKTMTAKEVIIQNRKTITSLKRKISNLEERVDGLTSLIEGLNATISELRIANESKGVNAVNTDTALLKELGIMIDKINNTYVSKDELNHALKGKYKPSTETPKETTKNKESEKETSPSTLYSEGVRFFVKKRYNEAKKRFILTDRKGYKPAASNYYLGEIAYYTKKYEDAIFFYKKSASLYDQASYIDVLLLHTAISLAKTGIRLRQKHSTKIS